MRLATLALLISGCSEITTLSFGAEDGIPPMWYEEQFEDLPPSYHPAEWPDGARTLEINRWQSLTITVGTQADGSRDVTFTRDAWLLDAETSAFYRTFFGEEKIRATTGLSLDVLALELDRVDLERAGSPSLRVDGTPVDPGDSFWLQDELLGDLRSELLAGEDVFVPITVGFHLAPDALDALPSALGIYVKVQPTLYIDVLAL